MKTISTFEAKNKLSEVIGRAAAVVISYQEFQNLTAKKESLSDFLLNSPLRGAKLDLTRSKDTGRAAVDFSPAEKK